MSDELILHPKTLEEAVQNAAHSYVHNDRGEISSIVQACWRAKVAIYKNAPRDVKTLEALLATKTKEERILRSTCDQGAADVLSAECDALKHLSYLVAKFGPGTSADPNEHHL